MAKPIRCPRCDYIVKGLQHNHCPECGNIFDPIELRHRADLLEEEEQFQLSAPRWMRVLVFMRKHSSSLYVWLFVVIALTAFLLGMCID